MKVIIDGDSTPFKEEIIAAAKKYGVKAALVMSTEHFSQKNETSGAEVILVDDESQAADIRIMNIAEAGDIVVTNDMALSFMLQGKKAVVINSRGVTVSGTNLSAAMEIRHEEKKRRRSGKIKRAGGKGPKKYGREDAEKVVAALESAMKAGRKSPEA